MKKYFGLIFVFMLCCMSFIIRAEASEYQEVEVVMNNHKIEAGPKAFIYDGRTMVSLRNIAEEMSATIQWNAEEKSVLIDRGDKKVLLFLGNRYVFIEENGNEQCYQVDVAPMVLNDYTYVPLRFVAELFECTVDYYENNSEQTKVAIIYTQSNSYHDLQSFVRGKCKGELLLFGNETEDPLITYYKMNQEEYTSLITALEQEPLITSSVQNSTFSFQKSYARYNESISLSVLKDVSIGIPAMLADGNLIVRVIYQPSPNRISQPSAALQAQPKDYWKSAGYCEENEDRYRAYQEKTGYSGKDVVWRVNARLDLQEYVDYVVIEHDKLNDDPLVIVNKYHKIPDDYAPADLKKNSDGCVLRSETADAFDEMKRAAAAQGVTLGAMSGYRSVDYQRNLYNGYLAGDSLANVDTYSARAGHSEHHLGLAIDVYGYDGSPQYTWVKNHCHEYGFIVRYTAVWQNVTGYMDEPWHIRYIGKEHSMKMKENNIGTLEEYVGRYGTLE
ncbi:MAG: hypothetical protein E7399_07715 [Ruminococcaceae bacterium]|nr:hypothetical protein [Oscillospiraceae bacterium]